MLSFVLTFFLFFNVAVSYALTTRVALGFSENPNRTIFPGETVKIPLEMDFHHLNKAKYWRLVPGTSIEIIGGLCPYLSYDKRELGCGHCYLKMAVTGSYAGQVIQGAEEFYWNTHNSGYQGQSTSLFTIKVIPHPLSMALPDKLLAVAGQAFSLNVEQYINYYVENLQAGDIPEISLSFDSNKGLYFNPATKSILGTPTETGIINCKIAVHNRTSSAEAVNLSIEVGANASNKPRFKPQVELLSLTPGKNFQFDLTSLLDREEIKVGDTLHFSIVKQTDEQYFSIDPGNPTLLKAKLPIIEAGNSIPITIRATSNLGGDSDPLILNFPVAVDPTLKPTIQPVHLSATVKTNLYENLFSAIGDPAQDGSLRIILDRVEPEAPWLQVTKELFTVLEGIVPDEAWGIQYKLYMRAHTLSGGSSEPIVGTLDVKINPQLTPVFASNPVILPVLQPSLPYEFCFEEAGLIIPAYQTYPYTVRLAPDPKNPAWVSLTDNCIRVSELPNQLPYYPSLWLILSNIPGGQSQPFRVDLPIVGLLKNPNENNKQDPSCDSKGETL